MKKIITLTLLLPVFAYAQNSFSAFIQDSVTKEVLIGAYAAIKGTTIGNSSDVNGNIEIKNIPHGSQTVVFRYVGYETKELPLDFPFAGNISTMIIYMHRAAEPMQELVVTSTRTNSRIEDIPVRVEVIGGEEVNEEAGIKPANISKLLLESPSIQVQQTSAMNGNMSIRLQGLDGKYTQILKDGFPLYSGFAQGLSVTQIPPLDLQQVEIIKGSSSSLYGSDAIAGIINLVSKHPQEKNEMTFLLNQTSLLGSDVDGYFSGQWRKTGFSILSANNFQPAKDVNKDGFSDLPATTTVHINPTFYYEPDSNTALLIGLNGTLDNRKGGDMPVIENSSDDFRNYFEENVSKRISSQLKLNKRFNNNKSFTVKNSISYFNRATNQKEFAFQGNQVSSYSETSFVFRISTHQLVTGMNFVTENFAEDSAKSHKTRNYHYNTAGIFLQDDWKLSEKDILQAGIRTDYQNKFGAFALPRLAYLHKFTKNFYIRSGGGLGYKVPGIFSTASEAAGINNIQPLLPTVKAEKSAGANLDFNYKTYFGNETSVTVNQSFFTTQINNPLALDSFQFVNKDKPVVAKGFESNVRFRVDEFQIFAAYAFVDARRKYASEQSFVPLTPQHKLILDIFFEEEENYMVVFEASYLSYMYRDFDTKTQGYCLFNLVAQKHFKHFSIIANCENISDVRQTHYENIVVSPVNNPTFRQIYAPLEGRVFNVAVKIRI